MLPSRRRPCHSPPPTTKAPASPSARASTPSPGPSLPLWAVLVHSCTKMTTTGKCHQGTAAANITDTCRRRQRTWKWRAYDHSVRKPFNATLHSRALDGMHGQINTLAGSREPARGQGPLIALLLSTSTSLRSPSKESNKSGKSTRIDSAWQPRQRRLPSHPQFD